MGDFPIFVHAHGRYDSDDSSELEVDLFREACGQLLVSMLIIEAVQRGSSEDKIVKSLTRTFAAEEGIVRGDVRATIEQLVRCGVMLCL